MKQSIELTIIARNSNLIERIANVKSWTKY